MFPRSFPIFSTSSESYDTTDTTKLQSFFQGDPRGMAVPRSRIHCQRTTVDQRSIFGNSTLSLVPQFKFIDKARPCRSSPPFLAIDDDEINTSRDDSSTPCIASISLQEASYSLRFQMEKSVWDVIYKEVINCRDSNWTSMTLPGNTCKTIVKPPNPC